MAQPESQAADKAQWNDHQVDILLDYLDEHRAEGGDGGNFKKETTNSAAVVINSNVVFPSRPPKTGQMVKTKWTALKRTYYAIETYHNQSGCHWDSDKGASVEGDAVASVWNAYVAIKSQSHSSMRPFRNKGWCHYVKMRKILGTNSGARGRHAYHPATAALAPLNHSSQPSPSQDAHEDQLEVTALPVDTIMTDDPGFIIADTADTLMSIEPSPSITTSHTGASSTTSTAGGSHSSGKRLCDNTVITDSESELIGGMPSESYHSTPGTTSTSVLLPSLSPYMTLPVSSPAFKKARLILAVSVQSSSPISASGQSVMSSAARAAKITPAAAVVGMQGSINCLTDILEKALTTPSQCSEPAVDSTVSNSGRSNNIPSRAATTGSLVPTTIVGRTMKILATGDVDLPVTQKVDLMQILSSPGNENQLAVYAELEGDSNFIVCCTFVARVLECHAGTYPQARLCCHHCLLARTPASGVTILTCTQSTIIIMYSSCL